MSAYFSEISYAGAGPTDFVEVAVPTGTDTSSWGVAFYNPDGSYYNTLPLGAVQSTTAGHDAYVLDSGTSGFPLFNSGDAVALVDGEGNIIQFLSVGGSGPVTATAGPANGLTSTEIGSTSSGSSLETTDHGATYQAQSSPNPGTIPCFGPDTLIETPDGAVPVARLRPGDRVRVAGGGARRVLWHAVTRLHYHARDARTRPVLIPRDALGAGLPSRDLVVSPQHRLLMTEASGREWLVPARALLGRNGVRVMRGVAAMDCHHLAFARHEMIRAEGLWTESLLLGPMVLAGLSGAERARVRALFGGEGAGPVLNPPPVCPGLSVRAARARLGHLVPAGSVMAAR